MEKIFWQAISLALVLFLPVSALGYIPSAHFIIRMMLQRNQAIQDVTVEQTTAIFDDKSGYEGLQVREVLYLKFPDRYRLDTTLPNETKTTICSQGKMLTIVGNEVISHAPDEKITFKAFIINHSVDEVIQLLRSRNVNIERMGLGRFNGKIAYIIGANETETELPQLWIDKDRFLPLRFIAKEKKKESVTKVEVRYLNYRRIHGKFQYPSTVEFYNDNILTLRYQIEKVVVNNLVPDKLFNIKTILGNNP